MIAMSDLAGLPPLPNSASTRLVDDIQAALRDAIIIGELPAGYRLRENALAEHFGCSATPVREALRHLRHEGLVKLYPRRGAEVISPSLADVGHLYELRIVLEQHAARQAAEVGIDRADLTRIRRFIKAQAAKSANERDLNRHESTNFHRELLMIAGNPAITETVDRAIRQITAVQARYQAIARGAAAHAQRAHTAILNAVADRDPDRAADAMREHLEWCRRAVLARMEETSAEGRADQASSLRPRSAVS
jgi:DNA-binding GntR family transcriptional regulator